MSYAVVQDVPASWERYSRLSRRLTTPAPAGLILFLAGPTDEGVRIIGVFRDEAAWRAFRAGRLDPVVEALGGGGSAPVVVRDVHAKQTVLQMATE